MKKQGTTKIATISFGIAAASCLIGLMITGWQIGWGPFMGLHDLKMKSHPGNAPEYALENVAYQGANALSGKNVLFLGSSVTQGTASLSTSFADFLAVRNGCTAIKEAVPGTTLVDTGADSYIQRLCAVDEAHIDLLVCQLSTNDATKNMPLGQLSMSEDRADFDTSTVAGAIEWIISYAEERWHCPVVFFTNPKYESDHYGSMVDLLLTISGKWDVPVIDLWNDEAFNYISQEQRALYMNDAIHPTKAGYLQWWTPKFEEAILNIWD